MQPPTSLPDVGAKLDVLPKNIDHQLILRVAFGVHFVFTSLTFLSGWCPNVYAYYNGFLIAGYWIAASGANVDLAILKLIGMEAATALFDIFVIAIYYNKSSKEGLDFYCFVAFLLQLVGRFAALLGLHRIRKERRLLGEAVAEPSMARADYQPVHSTVAHAAQPPQPSEHVGYDYSAPTKIAPLPDLSARFAHGYQ